MMFTALLVLAAQTACAAHTCAKGIQSSMLLQTHGSLGAALDLQEDLGTEVTEHSEQLSPMLQYVAREFDSKASKFANRSNYTMSSDVRGALDIFLTYLKEMHNTTIRLHEADQADVDEALSMINSCSTLADGIHYTQHSVVTERNAHERCRENEVSLHTSSMAHCKDYSDKLTTYASTRPSCDLSKFSTPQDRIDFDNCLRRFRDWTHVLFENYEECRVSKETLTQKTDTCHEKQTGFESATCQVHGGFCSCEARTMEHFELRVDQVKKSERHRKADSSAAEHIMCMVDVLTTNMNITEEFDNCKTTEKNVDHLDVNYGTLPDAHSECNVDNGPCDQSWTAKEYENKTWFATAPTRDCMDCSFYTTTTTTAPAVSDLFDTFTWYNKRRQRRPQSYANSLETPTLLRMHSDWVITIAEYTAPVKITWEAKVDEGDPIDVAFLRQFHDGGGMGNRVAILPTYMSGSYNEINYNFPAGRGSNTWHKYSVEATSSGEYQVSVDDYLIPCPKCRLLYSIGKFALRGKFEMRNVFIIGG